MMIYRDQRSLSEIDFEYAFCVDREILPLDSKHVLSGFCVVVLVKQILNDSGSWNSVYDEHAHGEEVAKEI
jgi:hypothetical protein